jgi:hypothetical protein
VKCDETRPICNRCVKAHRQCDYAPRETQRPPNRSSSQAVLLPKISSQPANHVSPTATTPQSSSTTHDTARPGTQQLIAENVFLSDSPASDQSSNYSIPRAPYLALAKAQSIASASSPSLEPDSNEGLKKHGDRVLSNHETQFISLLQTKTPKWSFISGIIHLCRSDPTLTHMIMAVVGQQISSWEGRPQEQLLAVEHYRRGLADFARVVGSGEYERHTLLLALWLVAQYEFRFADNARDICRHLEGFNMAIVSHGVDLLPGLSEEPSISPNPANFKLPASAYQNVVNRLGLWIAYMDAIASTFELGGTVMHTLQYRWPNSIHRVFAGSRNALHEIWGDEYPANEAQDDQQNRVAFDLFHWGHLLRYKITEFRRAARVKEGLHERTQQLQYEISSVAEVRNSDLSPQLLISFHFLAKSSQKYRRHIDWLLCLKETYSIVMRWPHSSDTK